MNLNLTLSLTSPNVLVSWWEQLCNFKKFLWIIWHLKGKLCNGVFDYLLKVLSPFNAPKVVHRINTQQWKFWEFSEKKMKIEKIPGMIGDWVILRESRQSDFGENYLFHCYSLFSQSKVFSGPGAAVQVDLQGMSSLPCCRLSCKSPAFSSASLDFILSLLLQNNLT